MTRVRLIVTGDVEELALGQSLQRVFPMAHFEAVKKTAFTDNPLPAIPSGNDRITAIIDEMLAGGDAARVPGGEPFDFAIAVEDVELAHRPDPSVPIATDPQIQRIAGHVARGVDDALAGATAAATGPIVIPKGKARRFVHLTTDTDRRAYLAERCSFHFLCPMVEALFMADTAALQRAGAVSPSLFFATHVDLECFDVVLDPVYASHPNTRRGLGGPSWATPTRRYHPKHYTSFLCDPSGTKTRPYREKTGGARALRTLDWSLVVASTPFASLARALIVDLADMLGVAVPPWASGATHPVTAHGKNGRLRNVR